MKLEITTDSGKCVFNISTLTEANQDTDKLVNVLILEALWSLMFDGKLDPEIVEMYTQHSIAKKKGLIP